MVSLPCAASVAGPGWVQQACSLRCCLAQHTQWESQGSVTILSGHALCVSQVIRLHGRLPTPLMSRLHRATTPCSLPLHLRTTLERQPQDSPCAASHLHTQP